MMNLKGPRESNPSPSVSGCWDHPQAPPDPVAMTAEELCDRLKAYEFECLGGSLKNTVEWIELRRHLGTPSPRWG
jgi:hypothetical protein